MNLTSVVNNRIRASVSVFIVTLLFILWEYFNGGVVSHNLLARSDMPAFSNWWGLLTVPLLFWISIYFINRRKEKGIQSVSKSETKSETNSESKPGEFENKVLKRFLAALAFGLLMSLFWEFNFQSILQYLILLPVVIAFFKPVHLPEYLMGFVLGMLFTFGGVLPILFGLILSVVCFIINKVVRIFRDVYKPDKN